MIMRISTVLTCMSCPCCPVVADCMQEQASYPGTAWRVKQRIHWQISGESKVTIPTLLPVRPVEEAR